MGGWGGPARDGNGDPPIRALEPVSDKYLRVEDDERGGEIRARAEEPDGEKEIEGHRETEELGKEIKKIRKKREAET